MKGEFKQRGEGDVYQSLQNPLRRNYVSLNGRWEPMFPWFIDRAVEGNKK